MNKSRKERMAEAEAYAELFRLIGASCKRMTDQVCDMTKKLEKSFDRIDRVCSKTEKDRT
jgi:hypothetical protein